MPFRLHKSFKLAPGLRINLSKSGIGLSAGPRGFKLNRGPRGLYLHTSIPGSGISHSTRLGGGKRAARPGKSGTKKSGCGSRLLMGGIVGLAALFGCTLLAQFAPTPEPSPTETIVSTQEPVAAQISATPPSAAAAVAPSPKPTAVPSPEPSPTAVATLPARGQEAPILLPTDTPTAVPATATPTSEITPAILVELIPTQPPATATPRPSVPQVIVNRVVNIRQGPGTDYAVIGSGEAGQPYTVTGKDAGGTWWAIDYHGQTGWVFGELVTAVSVEGVPVVAAPSLPAPAGAISAEPVQANPIADEAPLAEQSQTTHSGEANPNAFSCTGGCAEPPDSSCAIKGNVNREGERIYHTPTSNWYTRTDIKPEEGDRWFCTIAEAEAAGFRAPQR